MSFFKITLESALVILCFLMGYFFKRLVAIFKFNNSALNSIRLWGRKAAGRDNKREAGRTEAVAASAVVIVVRVLIMQFLLGICEPEKS